MRRLIFILFSIFILSCDNPFLEEDLLKRPSSERCGECHKNIYTQWQNSRHAKAWISEDFIKSSENRTKAKCLSCHAPLEITPFKKPVLRDKHREEGVNCVSCHYKEKTNSIHGPYDVFSPPHYSTRNLTYTKSEICSSCHRETFKQWQKSKSGYQCQNCHMPSKKGSLVQVFPFEYLHFPKEVHNHKFIIPKPKENVFEFKISYEEGILTVNIKNNKIPHNIPTADNGKPKYYLKVLAFDKDNNKILDDIEIILPDEPLPYGRFKDFMFFLDKKPEVLKIILFRKLSYKREKERILKREFRLN